MLKELIALILVILIMNLFLIYTIKNLSNRFKEQAREVTLKNLSSYDSLIEEKEKKINELNNELSKLESEIRESKEKVKKITSNPRVVASSCTGTNLTEYEDDSFFSNYLYVKNSFNLNYKEIVEEFINDIHVNDLELKEIYNSILKKFDINTYYYLIKIEDSKQEESLRELLSLEEAKVLDEYYLNYEEFTVEQFYDFIKEKLIRLNPKVLIKVNGDFKYLERIDSRIIVENDDAIIEGIKILYQGKVIDYSL